MAGAKLEKTRWPGIYRRGDKYVVIFRDAGGKQRRETVRTLDEARALKRRRDGGENHAAGRLTFAEYARDWIGRHPCRESTREDYAAHLEAHVIDFLGEKRRLADVTPLLCNQLVAHLRSKTSSRKGPDGTPLPYGDSTIQTILKPLRACMAQAKAEGLIQHNPCTGLKVPRREVIDDHDEEDVRALTAEQLRTFLELVPTRHRLMFRFLASTGLRVSELFALQWQHLELDGSHPRVRVRRAIVRGRIGPPKTRHGKRDVPLPASLVHELRGWRKVTEWPGDTDLVFPAMTGTPHNYGNLRSRILTPIGQEAGVPWATFHTFRHTCASMLFAEGRNVKQVQRWLGHHSASFTLDTYVHLLSDELDEPLELPGGDNKGTTTGRYGLVPSEAVDRAEMAR
jgi:integrase